jgi:crossover junction endodeoxyribonuclease RuvC
MDMPHCCTAAAVLQALLTLLTSWFDQSVGKTITIFGIDPGTRTLGFGWIEIDVHNLEIVVSRGCGVIEATSRTPSQNTVPMRLTLIMRELGLIFAQRQPTVVVVEKVFLGKNVDSAFVLGQARGVVLALAAGTGATIREESAKTAKKSVTGRGSAEKTEVRSMLGRLLAMSEELESLPIDASDGLALAYQGWRSLIASQRFDMSVSDEKRERKVVQL